MVLEGVVALTTARGLSVLRLAAGRARSAWARSAGRAAFRSGLFGLALTASSLLVAPVASAQVALRWEAPANCPRRETVLSRIRQLVGTSLDKTEGLEVEGSIVRADKRYELTLLVRDGHEVRKRVIVSDSCSDLAGAAAVALALLVGIDISGEAPTDGTTGAGATGAGTTGAASSDRGSGEGSQSHDANETSKKAASDAQNEDRREAPDDEPGDHDAVPGSEAGSSKGPWAILVRAPTGTLAIGPLPESRLGVGLGAGARYGAWRWLLTGHLSQGKSVDAAIPGNAYGAELKLFEAELLMCRGFRWAPFEVAPCVGVALEHLTARGYGDGVSPQAQRATWPAPSLGVTGYWYALESLAFFANVSGYLELSRPRVVVEGLGEVVQLSPVAAGATLGLEWIL